MKRKGTVVVYPGWMGELVLAVAPKWLYQYRLPSLPAIG